VAWVKIPADHHPLFVAAVPKDPRVTTVKMFGGIAAKVNGQMFAGLFAKSFIVKLDDADREAALALDGAEPFDPMGNGRVMSSTVLMPEETFGEDAELRSWLRRALDHTLKLPAKPVTPKETPVAAKPAANLAMKPAANLVVKPAANLVVKPAANLVVKPAAANLVMKPAANLVMKPAANLVMKPAANLVMKPAAKPAAKPAPKRLVAKPAPKKPVAKPAPKKKR